MQLQWLWLILLVGPVLAWGQDLPVPGASGGATPPAMVPSNLTADIPSIGFSGQSESPGTLLARLTAGAAFDSNAQSWSSRRGSDQRFLVAPSLQWQERRQHTTWGLQYSPSFNFYQHSGHRDTHAVSGNVGYNPTERLQLHLRQDYIRTDDPFAQAESPLPSAGVLNGPTVLIATSGITQINYRSDAGVDYALSEYRSIGVDSTFNKYYVVPSTALNASQVATESAYYSQQLSPRYSLGVQFAFTDMSFMASPIHSNTYSVLYSQTIKFSTSSSLMLYGGPSFTQSRNAFPVTIGNVGTFVLLIHDSGWSPAVGMVYGWSGTRTALQLSASHQVSNGGGVMYTGTTNSGSINLSRRLAATWTASLNGTATDSNSLSLFRGYGRWRMVTGSAVISHDITRNLRADLRYLRVYQPSTANWAFAGNQNMVQLTMTYSFLKPLGK